MTGLGKGGWQLFHNPEGQQDLPSQVFHHFAPGTFLRRISHGSIAWSSAEGAFRGHPRRCAEICRSTSYTYLNLCLSLEEPKCLHADSRWTRWPTGSDAQRALLLQPWWNLIWWDSKVHYPLTVKRRCARHLFVVRTMGTRKLILFLYALCTHFQRHLEKFKVAL